MKQNYETDIPFTDNIHKILALAFLDPNVMATGFEFLCANFGDEYQEILDYIEDNYIGREHQDEKHCFPLIFGI